MSPCAQGSLFLVPFTIWFHTKQRSMYSVLNWNLLSVRGICCSFSLNKIQFKLLFYALTTAKYWNACWTDIKCKYSIELFCHGVKKHKWSMVWKVFVIYRNVPFNKINNAPFFQRTQLNVISRGVIAFMVFSVFFFASNRSALRKWSIRTTESNGKL